MGKINDKIINSMTFAEKPMQRSLSLKNEPILDVLDAFKIIGKTITPAFVIDKDNEDVYREVAKWCIADNSMRQMDDKGRLVEGSIYKGLYISGNTGTGKSVLMKIVSIFLSNMGVRCKFYGQEQAFKFKTYHCCEICDDYAQSGDLQKYISEMIINIEDLGAEAEVLNNGTIKAETMYMGNRCNVMRRILEGRGDKTRVTMATSNYRMYGDKLQMTYGNRVSSRMKEMFNYFELKGKDRRLL